MSLKREVFDAAVELSLIDVMTKLASTFGRFDAVAIETRESEASGAWIHRTGYSVQNRSFDIITADIPASLVRTREPCFVASTSVGRFLVSKRERSQGFVTRRVLIPYQAVHNKEVASVGY